MNRTLNFSSDDDPFSNWSVEACQRRLKSPGLDDRDRHRLHRRLGQMLVNQQAYSDAVEHLHQAWQLQPDDALVHVYWAEASAGLGDYNQALTLYDRALEYVVDSQSDLAAQIWSHRGNLLRTLKHYSQALESYRRALEIQPSLDHALSNQAVVLGLLKRHRDALASADRAIALAPHSAEAWNNRGIVVLTLGRLPEALEQFDQAIALQPKFDKAWNNRAIALAKLGREAEALISLGNALHLCSTPREAWYASAWAFHGYLLMKSGQPHSALESYRRAQHLQPDSYPAAFYKLVCLLMTGQIVAALMSAPARSSLLHDLGVVGRSLGSRFLVLFGAIALIVAGNRLLKLQENARLAEFADQLVPTLLSIGIVGLVIVDLWRNRSRLNFVWRTYFQSGLLTYIRAVGIILLTLTTFDITLRIAPPFLLWGWANLVFGQPGNVILQPFFKLLESFSNPSVRIADLGGVAHALVGAIAPWSAPLLSTLPTLGQTFNYTSLLIVGFWLLLLLGIPFWARLEERIFRQGANSWKQICIRSTQFGLMHLLAGIPILGGLVLIVPGFLFACRYKYVHDRHLKRYRDPLSAQEAGVTASTADHAVYNAILITTVAGTILATQMSGL